MTLLIISSDIQIGNIEIVKFFLLEFLLLFFVTGVSKFTSGRRADVKL